MKHNRSQNGFTLLEVMVVVMIIAVISGMSVLALNQASDRRYFSQADNLLLWFQQLSEFSVLEGVTYGFIIQDNTLFSMVFYQQRWHKAVKPEPFSIYDTGNIRLLNTSTITVSNTSYKNTESLPNMVMLPNGFIEPALDIQLRYSDIENNFIFSWDDESSTFLLASDKQ